jgi:hypothetical protein
MISRVDRDHLRAKDRSRTHRARPTGGKSSATDRVMEARLAIVALNDHTLPEEPQFPGVLKQHLPDIPELPSLERDG